MAVDLRKRIVDLTKKAAFAANRHGIEGQRVRPQHLRQGRYSPGARRQRYPATAPIPPAPGPGQPHRAGPASPPGAIWGD